MAAHVLGLLANWRSPLTCVENTVAPFLAGFFPESHLTELGYLVLLQAFVNLPDDDNGCFFFFSFSLHIFQEQSLNVIQINLFRTLPSSNT